MPVGRRRAIQACSDADRVRCSIDLRFTPRGERMVGRREAMKGMCAGLLVLAVPSCGPTGERPAAILQAFRQQITAEQYKYKQVSDPIAASPALAATLCRRGCGAAEGHALQARVQQLSR